MKIIKTLFLVLAVLSSFTVSTGFAIGKKELYTETTEEIRVIAAKEKLSRQSGSVVLYAKGLCCPSCAIGIRKMISRLDFVDRKTFNNGVELDPKTQLVTVAIESTKEADFKLLSKAIERAGYTPVRGYKLIEGKLQTEPLATQKKQVSREAFF